MWLIAIVAIICTVLVISLMIGYTILHWRRYKAKQLLPDNMKNEQRYILGPSPYDKREATSGIPYTTNEPINIQPHFKTLQFMDMTMLTDENINNNNSRFTPEHQTPLVSHYESENLSRKSRRKRKRKSIHDSYGPSSSGVIETPTIVISEAGDNNANFAKIESNAKPELTFSIFYDEPSKDLHITVIKASSLPGAKHFASGAHYFRVRVHVGTCSTRYHETRYVCGTRAPMFGETFIVSGLVNHKLRECAVRFSVVEFEELQHCWTVVGEVTQPLIDLRANSLLKVTKTLHQI
jgi:hypothetical protein